MKKILVIVLLIIVCAIKLSAQVKTIKGRIISENLELLPGVNIQDSDTVLLGTTDIDGYFSIEIPQETQKLILSWIGMEWTTIELSSDCNSLEVIMMVEVIYDFITLKKINKLRNKRFKKLDKVRELAVEKEFFKNENTCYTQCFELYAE